ncbi:lysophospholipase [Leuconostoc lactis]|uniref:GDSL-type esterase/lipase family protein n=1 Tax=Leuconostoc lactis TaxID=1246 RepID=UPI001C1F2B5C|nr:GDSL-type esterase/lipase family protein [Leuconostoc lactis]MBU7537091.1 lysophospholipase [Leuconostoc lactis]
MRKYVTIGSIVLLLVGLGVGIWLTMKKPALNTATPQQAAKIAKVNKVQLVALGDSLTEGVGDDGQQQGYTGRIAQQIQQKYDVDVTMANFGRSGDRSDQIQHRLATQSNMQSAMQNAQAIILTVGGNDLQQLLLKNQSAQSPEALTKAVKSGQSAYRQQLTTLFQTIRQYNPHAPIYIFGNYNPIFVHFPNRQDFNTDVALFNAINQEVAKAGKNSHYVGVFDLTYGQYRTESARKKLIASAKVADQTTKNPDQFLKKLSDKPAFTNKWISTTDHYHPNKKGYDFMTTQLFQQMRRGQAAWLTTP